MLATSNSAAGARRPAGLMRCFLAPWMGFATRCCFVAYATVAAVWINASAQNDPRAQGSSEFAERAEKAYENARGRFQADSNNPDAIWQFARTCFDWADYVTTDTERAGIAEEGISACEHLLKIATNSVPGHFYLAMNLGQLARTKTLGALKIVTRMEAEFNIVLGLDPDFDFAGSDRNLGLLYLEAPNWPVSVGSKSKARQHLQKALKRAPGYPANHLNLIEAELEWGDKKDAAAGLDALDELWPEAQKKLAGDDWAPDWADWEKRRDAARKEIRGNPPRLEK